MAAGSKVSETTDIMVHDNEQDLVIKLGKMLPSDRWKLNGGNSEVSRSRCHNKIMLT